MSQTIPARLAIAVDSRNIWFLERSIPLFGKLAFFPPDVVRRRLGGPVRPKKITIETDQDWSFETDIDGGSMTFANSSRNRGTGKWIAAAVLKPGDRIIIEKIEEYRYYLSKESSSDPTYPKEERLSV